MMCSVRVQFHLIQCITSHLQGQKTSYLPNVMAALPNIGGALCSTLQSLADAHYQSAVR